MNDPTITLHGRLCVSGEAARAHVPGESVVVPRARPKLRVRREHGGAGPRSASSQLYCPFSSAVNVHADLVQTATVEWAERMGLARTPKQRARLDAAKIGWLEAFVLHDADREGLQLAVDWTTLFCALDDVVESECLGPIQLPVYLARLSTGFRRPAEALADPLARALADVSTRLERVAGALVVERFARLLDELFAGYVWEEINRWQRLRPSGDAYRTMRAITIGLRPQFALAEVVEQIELSDEARNHPDLIRLEQITCRAVGWANDIFTYEKELQQGEIHNLVLVLMDCESLPLRDAVQRAAAAHDSEVRAFQTTEAALPSFGEQDAMVRRYVTVLRRWIRGHLDWAVKTGRYRERQSLQTIKSM